LVGYVDDGPCWLSSLDRVLTAAITLKSGIHHPIRGVSLDFGGIMSAEVRRALNKAEKYASLGGDELAAMMAFVGSATRLAKTVEGVRENGAPPPQLSPLRLIASGMVTHPEVADKIRACVDDQGEFKDGASPELRRARSQRATVEGRLRRTLQGFGNGTIAMHQGRMVLAVTPPAPPGALVVGVAAGGALVLVEPPSVVMLNGELAQHADAEETAIDAIRRRLTNDVAEAVVDLMQCLDLVTRLDVIAARWGAVYKLNSI
jgi:DNA mismatch repair protein MutS2